MQELLANTLTPPHNDDVVVFKPSPWPVIGSYVLLPIVMGVVLSFAVNEAVGAVSVIVVMLFFFAAFRPGLFFLRSMNAMGHINSVTLSPEGITHRHSNLWFVLVPPKTYQYRWSDIHSLRAHSPAIGSSMIIFTPVRPVVGSFYRSIFDGSYGVPKYGRGNEMLEAMTAMHKRFGRLL